MPVKIRDVAKRLNLSITTVSRALDGYDDVAEPTRARVLEAVNKMGYVPSRAARQLRRQRADAIGYILPAVQPRFADPFYSEFVAGMADEAAILGFDVLIAAASPGQSSERSLYERWIQSGRVDGVVLNRIRCRDWRVRFLAKQGVPFAALGKSLDRVEYPYVDVDAVAGFVALVNHLAGLGHRRIAFIGGPPGLMLQTNRLNGYRQGLRASGLREDPRLVLEGDLTQSGGERAASALLSMKRPPTAIIAINDLTAIGALACARARGLVPGQGIAIAGYDGVGESEHTQPPLTTLDQPLYDIARRLTNMTWRQVLGQPIEERHILLQPNLIIRGSTAG